MVSMCLGFTLGATPENVALRMFFFISPMNQLFFCVHLGEINRPIVARQHCFAQTSRLTMCTWFHYFDSEFQLSWLIASKRCLCDQPPIKASGPKVQMDFSWQKLPTLVPVVCCQRGKTPSCVALDEEGHQKPMLDLSGLLINIFFLLLLLCIFCCDKSWPWVEPTIESILSSVSLNFRRRLLDSLQKKRIDHCFHKQLEHRLKSRNMPCKIKEQQGNSSLWSKVVRERDGWADNVGFCRS